MHFGRPDDAPEWRLGNSPQRASGEDEALGGEGSSPEWVTRGQRESVVAGGGEHRAVVWIRNPRTRDLEEVQPVLGADLDAVTNLEAVEAKPVDVVGGDADVARTPRPWGRRVVSWSVIQNIGAHALMDHRAVPDNGDSKLKAEAINRRVRSRSDLGGLRTWNRRARIDGTGWAGVDGCGPAGRSHDRRRVRTLDEQRSKAG